MIQRFIGIDPGLIDTGVVRLNFDVERRQYSRDYQVFTGLKDSDMLDLTNYVDSLLPVEKIFIEAYKPRNVLNSDAQMGKLVNDIKRVLPGSETLLNMGVKKLVTQPMMEALDVWRFPQSTHHQDLRSAARIAILGMLKQAETNQIVYRFVVDYLNNRPWTELKKVSND